MTNTLYIGNKNYSSWSLRGWLPLKKAGVSFEESIIPLRQDDSQVRIRAVSEGWQVPVLKTDQGTIYDSLAISEWAAEQAPDLWPEDAQQRAAARSATALMHAGFRDLRMACPMNMKCIVSSPQEDKAALADAARINALWSRWLEVSGGPFLFGKWSIADAFYAPVVSRFVSWRLPVYDSGTRYIETMQADADYADWKSAGLAEKLIMVDIDKMMIG